jgi:hypothetical protein
VFWCFSGFCAKKEDLHVAILAAWAGVHGLTMVKLDGPAGTVPPDINDLLEKVTRAIGHGLFRK